VVPEAELQETEAGLVAARAGWFVMKARGGTIAYARFPEPRAVPYPDGLLPD
jgi:hypothetical protein